MAAFIDCVRSASQPVLWLDATAYAGRLLARNAVPWLDAAGLVAWQRKAQALLRSDVIAVPVAQICTSWVEAHNELRTEMGARRRVVFPLRTLLADDALRSYLVGVVSDLCSTFRDGLLVLAVPSPRRWIVSAHMLGHDRADSPTVDDEEAESAATYIADFLRSFADCGVDALLLEESAASAPVSLDDPSYAPILNLSGHYRWDMGIRLPAPVIANESSELAFVVAPAPMSFPTAGVAVASEFWSGAAPPNPPAGGFLFAEIPEDAAPERVLERLAVLRASPGREKP